ncbi:helicase-related protein [Agathobaculum massiliense]|uniref:helicase-related protein n=1 Tax=Agathobaculum massiliense TaxID=3014267 RepID=UPI00131D8D22|nr:helicase-related protein [Agathobaculum massiliense]
MTEKLMKAIYSDLAQTITLTAWADTVAVDPRDNLLIAVRLGGYPEVTAGLVNAVSGGGTLSVQLDGETLVCTPQQGRYSKAVSRDGTYAVAALLWDNQSARKQGGGKQTEETEEQKEKTDKAQEARVYYLACPVRDKTALYHEIDKVSTIPMLPEFRDYMINELQARDMLAPCRVYTTGEPFAIWRLTCTPDDQNIADVLTDGLKAGVIRIPSTWPCQPDAFTEINGVAGYLRAFGSVIASRIRRQFQPLYDPAQEPLSEGVLGLDQFVAQTAGYHLYGAQLAAAEALRRRLQTARFGLLIAECGSGKSKVGSLALQAYFLQKHRKCLHIVLCPSHMTGKWVRELEEAIPNARAAIVRTPADMDALYAGYARGVRTVFAVMSRENARDGYMRRPAVRWDARRRGFTCPDCGSMVQMEFMDCGKRTLTDATPEYFRTETRANRKCESCGAVLWTATTAEEQSEWVRISHLGYVHRRFAYLARDACKTAAAKKQLAALLREPDRFMAARGACRRFPLSTYIKNRYRGKIDGLIADELHQFSADSGQGDAMGELFAAAKKCIGMTATLINGYASGIFYLLYRMCACRMEQDGQSYAAPAQFAREYGVTEDTYEVTEGGYNSNRRTAKRKKRSRQKPGVSPLVYSRFLLENGVFLSLMDMGKDLPEYEEIPVPLRLPENQQRACDDLEHAFHEIFKDRSREGRKLARKLLSVSLNLMMAYPDQPYGHKPVVHPVTADPILVPEDSGAPEEQTEKDRRTLEIIHRKVNAGERVLLYVNWVRLDSRTRLKRFLTDTGVRAEIMEDTVPPRGREEWVANHLRQGMQVMIVNPNLVETGLDLNDFTTLIFYDMAFKLFTFRQASRRSWRINQTAPRVEVYILYYRHTMQERAVRLMASKLAVAGVIEGGVLTDEGLAAMSESEDMTSALARELAEGIRHEDAVEDIAASFRKMAVLHPAQERQVQGAECGRKAVPASVRKETKIQPVPPAEQLSLWELAG